MKLYAIFFSPTGGTRKVCQLLTSAWQQPAEEVDLSDSRRDFSAISLTAEDICVVAVPSFGGRVPPVAAQRLGQIQGGGARAVFATVYGNRAFEDTLTELEDVLKAAGFRCAAAVAAVAEHSIMHQFAAGRPDARDKEQLADFSRQIRSHLERSTPVEPAVPGNRPYKELHTIPMVPQTLDTCNRCGSCASLCPVQAIPAATPEHTDPQLCISCMRCVQVCPQHVRRVAPEILAATSRKLEAVCSQPKENQLFL